MMSNDKSLIINESLSKDAKNRSLDVQWATFSYTNQARGKQGGTGWRGINTNDGGYQGRSCFV